MWPDEPLPLDDGQQLPLIVLVPFISLSLAITKPPEGLSLFLHVKRCI